MPNDAAKVFAELANAMHSKPNQPLVLDYRESWSLPLTEWDRPELTNLFGEARLISRGIRAIAERVETAEQEIMSPQMASVIAAWGTIPGIDLERQLELRCDFDCFAVLACNYARIIGHIASGFPTLGAPNPAEYAKSVLGPVCWYRDKVAGTEPAQRETPMTPRVIDSSVAQRA